MRPYGGSNLDNPKRIFNQRLSSARKCVESAFGTLAAKWEIFQRPLKQNVTNSINVIKASCALYNFVRARDGKFKDLPTSLVEASRCPRQPLLTNIEAITQTRRRSDTATQIRKKFKNFFINENPVDWINRIVSI